MKKLVIALTSTLLLGTGAYAVSNMEDDCCKPGAACCVKDAACCKNKMNDKNSNKTTLLIKSPKNLLLN